MDHKEIESIIEAFFDASYTRDADKMATAFHAGSEYFGFSKDGALSKRTGADFVEGIRKSSASSSQPEYPRVQEIISIEFTGENAAVARTKLRVGNTLYTDILCFMRLGGVWGIIAKIASGVPVD